MEMNHSMGKKLKMSCSQTIKAGPLHTISTIYTIYHHFFSTWNFSKIGVLLQSILISPDSAFSHGKWLP